MKLSVRAFALTCGLCWGIVVFALSWWFILFGEVDFNFLNIGEFTRGYDLTPLGSFVAAFWAFADGLIAGIIFASVYNFLVKYFKKEPKL